MDKKKELEMEIANENNGCEEQFAKELKSFYAVIESNHIGIRNMSGSRKINFIVLSLSSDKPTMNKIIIIIMFFFFFCMSCEHISWQLNEKKISKLAERNE